VSAILLFIFYVSHIIFVPLLLFSCFFFILVSIYISLVILNIYVYIHTDEEQTKYGESRREKIMKTGGGINEAEKRKSA